MYSNYGFVDVLNGIKLIDLNKHLISLPRGIWEVDNQIVETKAIEQIQVDDISNIYYIIYNSIITGYTDGTENITTDQYLELRKLLPVYHTDEDGEDSFNTLDDEFEVRKFNIKWKELKKEIPIKKGPIPVSIKNAYNKTSVEFIIPLWKFGMFTESDICIYKRELAIKSIFFDVCKKYDIKYEDPSNMKFVKIFDSYILYEEYDKMAHDQRGTFEELNVIYQKDKERITNKILVLLAKNTKPDKLNGIQVAEIHDKISEIYKSVNSIDPKSKTANHWRSSLNQIANLTKSIEERLTVDLKKIEK